MSGDKKTQWVTWNKVPIADLATTIGGLNQDLDRTVLIGTDGQKYRKNIHYVTCVAVVGAGAFANHRLFYSEVREKDHGSLSHKLFKEVGLSIDTALLLCDVVPADDIEVHIDANTNIKYRSAQYHDALAGMVASYQFRTVLKPDAWLASHAADHIVKHKHEAPAIRKRNKRKAKKAG